MVDKWSKYKLVKITRTLEVSDVPVRRGRAATRANMTGSGRVIWQLMTSMRISKFFLGQLIWIYPYQSIISISKTSPYLIPFSTRFSSYQSNQQPIPSDFSRLTHRYRTNLRRTLPPATTRRSTFSLYQSWILNSMFSLSITSRFPFIRLWSSEILFLLRVFDVFSQKGWC